MLSARKPTFTPAPVARSAALGEPSVLAARIEVSASGSSSGWAGSDGQIACGAATPGVAGVLDDEPVAGVAGLASGNSTLLSGITSATAGSAASAAACSAVTVAANALPSVKCLTLVGAEPVSRPSTESWEPMARLCRLLESDLVAG